MGGEAPAQCVSIMTLLEPLPWEQLPVIRHGGGGGRTDIVCGYLYSEDPLFDPALRALPPVFVVRLSPGAGTGWVQASIAYALEAAAPPSNLSTSPIATRLPELLLIEVLRVHLATAPAVDQGWLGALHDPVLAPALALLHRSPARQVDGPRAGVRRGGLALVARRTVPRGPGSIADALPDGVAHAPRRRAAGHQRPDDLRRGATRRLRLRRGLQPGVQAGSRAVTEPLARRPPMRARDSLLETVLEARRQALRPGPDARLWR